jgi:putative peptidoglycan lipid II flippase
VGLAVLRVPITSLIFQRGQFTLSDTMATSEAILYYGLGMWAAGGIRILAAAFYSVKDTKTPFLTATAAMAVNIALNLYLMTVMAHAGLALASSLSVIFQFVMLAQLLRRRIGPLGLRRIAVGTARMALASAVMGGVCALTLSFLPPAPLSGLAVRAGIVAGELFLGISCYLIASRLLGCEEYRFVSDMVKARIARGR